MGQQDENESYPPLISASEAQIILQRQEIKPRGIVDEVRRKIAELVFEALIKNDPTVKATFPAAHRGADMKGCAISFRKQLSEAGYTAISVQEGSEDHDQYVDMWLAVNFSLTPSEGEN